MKVKVVQPVQVVHAAKKYTIGQTADVPDVVGQEWVRQGWAKEVKPTKAAPRKQQ